MTMRTIGKTIWMTVGVAGFGVIAGIGLMMAGDWLGRRDGGALRMAVHAPASATLPITQPAPDAGAASAVSPAFALAAPEALPAIKLMGTMPADDPSNSTALFEDIERQTQTTMRRGERVGSWELTTIERAWVLLVAIDHTDSVRLELEGPTLRDVATLHRERVSLLLAKFQGRTPKALPALSDEARIADRQPGLDTFQGNALQMLSQGHVVPEVTGDQAGLRVARLTDSPWAAKVGLRAGDLVTAINGKPVLDPTKIDEVMRDFYAAPTLDFTIQRDGREVTLQYHMAPTPQAPISQGSP
ncbi:MAG: PDZ domain-containing protein [Candidatus Omnitrophota bacterium]|nr:PDZ domain-containing protein [Candidatus Omnitrophota bacterium]